MDRVEWNNLVTAHAPRFGAFLQSWEWGSFQQSLGRKIERLHVADARGVMLAQAVQLDLPFGWSYWQVPKGPLGTMPPCEMARELSRSFAQGAFVRIELAVVPEKAWKTKDVQPSVSSVLDLTQGLDAVVANMKPKTRYNVRLAEKKGVTARIVTGTEAMDDLARLLEQTAARDKFSLHPLAYYEAMLASLKDGPVRCFLAFAEYEGRPLAANITIDFNGQRTYLHGASSNLHRNLMAPAYLHRFLIEDAIKKGMASYDFWGVAPVGARKGHAWAGITQFKLGFGGEIVTSPGTYDVTLNTPIYALYRGSKIIRALRRRLHV